MSNTINWGKIYEKTAWGIGVVANTISWGKIYANLAGSIPSFALDFANIANDFTFTRSSFATRVNEFGLIETVTDLGSDLVTNGTFDTDLSGWSIQGGNTNWVWDNGTATMNGGVESGLTQAIGDNTTLYQVTIEVVALNGSSLRVLDASSGNVFLSEGINTIQTTLLGGVLYIKPSAIVGDIVIDNVSVKEVLEDDVPRIDYSGSTFDVPVLGDELIVNGDFATDSDWVKQEGWTINNGTANFVEAGGSRNIYQGILTLGKTYELTFTVLNYVSGFIRNVSQGGFIPEYTSNGTYTETFVATYTNLFLKAALNSELSIDNVSVKEVTAYTTADKGAFLLEPQSTNLLSYSEDFSQSDWSKQSGITATYNTTETLSPDGTYNATKLVGDGTTGIFKASISVSGIVSRSVYLKSVTGTTTATFKEPNTGVPSAIPLTITNEWQRFEMIGDNGSSSQGLFIDDITSDGLYIWGAQVEALPYATSYIPTNGSSVTRSAESCVDATPTINSEEGTLYAEISALADSNDLRLIELNDKTALNRVLFYYRSNDRISFNITINNVNVLSKNISSANVTDTHKLALLWSQDNFSAWVDGVKVSTITSGNTFAPNTLTDLDFSDPFGNLNFYGNTKDLKIYDKALTDDELIELTTI